MRFLQYTGSFTFVCHTFLLFLLAKKGDPYLIIVAPNNEPLFFAHSALLEVSEATGYEIDVFIHIKGAPEKVATEVDL